MLQIGSHFSRIPQDRDVGARCHDSRFVRDAFVVATMGLPRPQHDVDLRVEREQMAKRLSIAVPEFLSRKPSSDRSAQQTGNGLTPRKIDEENHVGTTPEEVTNGAVVSVAHPARLLRKGAHAAAKGIKVEGSPTLLVVERVELQVGRVEDSSELSRERRLTAPRRALYDDPIGGAVVRFKFVRHRESLLTLPASERGPAPSTTDIGRDEETHVDTPVTRIVRDEVTVSSGGLEVERDRKLVDDTIEH